MSVILEINDVVVERGKRAILKVDHFAIAEHETLAVIGPNGAGKSTLLLVLSHILQPQRGSLRLRGQAVDKANDLAYRRKIALVLQSPLLLDDTVFNNVAAGLRFRGMAADEIKPIVEHWLERFGVADLRQRRARSLSGGEAQRVSLARAFALSPDILLLDEPFSALDAPTRQRLLQDFQSIITSAKTTAVFVTHALDEALMLGSRLAVMMNGEMRQNGLPMQVLNAPLDADVAAFVGAESIIPGVVMQSQEGMLRVDVAGQTLEAVGDFPPGRAVYLCLRPEDITIWGCATEVSTSARNNLPGRITRLTQQGALVRVELDCGFHLVALVTRPAAQTMRMCAEMKVHVTFKASAIHVVPR